MGDRQTSDTTKRPDLIPVGPSVRLISLPAIAKAFAVPVRYIKWFMKSLDVPWVRVYGAPYINLFALESVLFVKLLPGMYRSGENGAEFVAYLQQVAGLEYCSTDEKAMKRRLQRVATRLVNAHHREGSYRASTNRSRATGPKSLQKQKRRRKS